MDKVIKQALEEFINAHRIFWVAKGAESCGELFDIQELNKFQKELNDAEFKLIKLLDISYLEGEFAGFAVPKPDILLPK